MKYYCARLLVICLVNTGKAKRKHICDYPFVVFKARDYEHAFERALTLGKEQETKYKNSKGEMVKWVLAKVEAINCLGENIDGIEVGSLMDVWKSKKPIKYSKRFNPKNSKTIYG